jgi:hypothetical protein
VITLGPATSPAPEPVSPAASVAAHEVTTPREVDAVLSKTAPPSTGGGTGTQRILGSLAGGIGVAGLAVGGVFGLITLSEKSQQQDDCGSPCSSTAHARAVDDHSTGMTSSTISTVGFITGGALVVGGALLFFTANHAPEQTATKRVVVVPSVGSARGGLLFEGEF